MFKDFKNIKSSIIFQALAVLCLLFTFIAGWNAKTSVSVYSFLAFIFFMFYSALDKFVRIKASVTGFEAETRKVIKEAESTIEELQTFGKNSVLIFLSVIKWIGRAGTYSSKEEQLIENRMRSILKNLKFSDNEITSFIKESDWFKITCHDYTNKILSKINALSLNETQKNSLIELRASRLEDISSPSKLKSVIEKHNLTSKEIDELLEDYKYYTEHCQHRRLSEWEKSGY